MMSADTLKAATTAVPIHPLLGHRWSPRAFADTRLKASELLSLFEAARWSPSSRNEQPWRFIYATKDQQEAFDRLISVLNESNRRWAEHAPLLILAFTTLTFHDNGSLNRHAFYDVGQSVAHLTVQAESLGLRVHQMGGFHAERARTTLGVPEGIEPVVMLAVGYPAPSEVLPDDLRAREEAPRTRKSLEEFVFNGSWGESNPESAGAKELPDKQQGSFSTN